MTERLAHRLSLCFVDRGIVEAEKRELLAYGIFHIISSALHVLLLLASGLGFGVLPEVSAYALCFCLLKRTIGGSHASRHWVCLWGFTLAALLGALVARWLETTDEPVWLPVVLSSTALLLIVRRAPVVHPNAPKRNRERLLSFRRRAITLAAVQLVAVCLCMLLSLCPALSLAGSMGGLSAAVTLLLPVPNPTGKEVREHEEGA